MQVLRLGLLLTEYRLVYCPMVIGLYRLSYLMQMTGFWTGATVLGGGESMSSVRILGFLTFISGLNSGLRSGLASVTTSVFADYGSR